MKVLEHKVTPKALYVVMELACFSLDEMPRAFRTALHSRRRQDSLAQAGSSLSSSGSHGGGRSKPTLLRSLVQDVLQGMFFLHTNAVSRRRRRYCRLG